MPEIKEDMYEYFATRCDELIIGKIFVPSYLVKKYVELTHDYSPTGVIRQKIIDIYNRYTGGPF